MEFDGQSIVVTGGNSGIGRGAAAAFKEAGGNVTILGRELATIEKTKADLGVSGDTCDVTDQAVLNDLMAKIANQQGKIDVLFANAGVAEFSPFEAHDPASFKRIMEINFFGTVNTIRAALPHAADGASIVLTTSIANQMGEPNSTAYAASKAAVRSLASTLSTDLAARGIRVNAVSPGPTMTPIFAKLGVEGEVLEQTKSAISHATRAMRMGEISDQVEAVLYLASKKSSFVVGQEIIVDGGLTGCISIA